MSRVEAPPFVPGLAHFSPPYACCRYSSLRLQSLKLRSYWLAFWLWARPAPNWRPRVQKTRRIKKSRCQCPGPTKAGASAPASLKPVSAPRPHYRTVPAPACEKQSHAMAHAIAWSFWERPAGTSRQERIAVSDPARSELDAVPALQVNLSRSGIEYVF